MPEWSPEILRCEWLDGATEASVGARFVASNKVRRGPAWKNRPVVTVAEPGQELAFSRTEKLAGTVVGGTGSSRREPAPGWSSPTR